ncbi:hypothetical protein [Bartonella quintana]|uniref:Uncharacterized protein n=1 Tax=Bartonella quintana JK 73 TaxID=1402976 RepID=W3TY64_BARQI|nr:hypothetical protein [Bartonella quintana]ETS14604.1 hypothetical protein Q650_01246 [Bartonella quintana JK 73rel]ETS16291.1 hypothetical protein Q649_01255 [Bartonella quintana JK 73]
MKTKSYITKQVRHDKPFSFVVEQKENMGASAEVTMSDIAKKLRSVHTQMQMKYSPHHLISRSSLEENFKSYLDDISRAILAEYYVRRQKEKKLFESLEQIIMLVQSLQSEKKSLEEATVTRRVSGSKSLDSVVQHLAQMACEENQERSSCQEVPGFSGQNSITPIQTNAVNVLQQGDRSSLLVNADSVELSLKEINGLVGSFVMEERRSDVQVSGRSIVKDQYTPSLKVESPSLNVKSGDTFFFLRYPVKKLLLCFLTIAFMAAVTLCFLRAAHF